MQSQMCSWQDTHDPISSVADSVEMLLSFGAMGSLNTAINNKTQYVLLSRPFCGLQCGSVAPVGHVSGFSANKVCVYLRRSRDYKARFLRLWSESIEALELCAPVS